MRNAVDNQLHALAMGEGVCRKKKLFTEKGRVELEGLRLGSWASYRRQELLRCSIELHDSLRETGPRGGGASATESRRCPV